MYSSSPSLWYRHPGTSFYILANNSTVSWPRAYYPLSYNYYDGNRYQMNYPEARVSIEEVEEVQENHDDDEELSDEIIDVGKEEFSAMGSVDELKSYEEEEAIANGDDLDAPLYSPISFCSSLSDGTNELIAQNLRRANDDDFCGDIGADQSPDATVEFDSRICGDSVQDRQVGAASIMEDEVQVDLQLEGNEDEREPELMDVEGGNKVERIQLGPAIRKSSRLQKKSTDGLDEAGEESPKKKAMRWMTRKRCDCCGDLSKRH